MGSAAGWLSVADLERTEMELFAICFFGCIIYAAATADKREKEKAEDDLWKREQAQWAAEDKRVSDAIARGDCPDCLGVGYTTMERDPKAELDFWIPPYKYACLTCGCSGRTEPTEKQKAAGVKKNDEINKEMEMMRKMDDACRKYRRV